MSATVLDGRAIARRIWDDVTGRGASFRARAGVPPGLAVVYGGDDPASASYRRQITRAFGAADLVVVDYPLDEASESELARTMAKLATDPAVHGVLVQLPLPDPLTVETIVRHLPSDKDVEGLHPLNAGALAQGRPAVVPSTPAAGLEILRSAGAPLVGKIAVVIGRSAIVGRPMAELLLREHATVVVCHSRTVDLGAITRQADILVAATGRAGLVTGSMVKPGAVVVDFGTNLVDGRLVGDVVFDEVSVVAGAITPVPGGTGPVTTAVLARNLLDAAERARPG